MRRLWIGLLLLLVLPCATFALDIPKLQSRVTDLAGLLTPEQIAALETKLKDLEQTDSTQIAVLIIPSLEGEPLEDYSVRVATAWRLGQKGRDNGALLIVALKERKVRIEVGYGLEPTLTDALSRRIIQGELVPRFRENDYYGGIDAATTAMIRVVRGVYQAPSGGASSPRPTSGWRSIDFLIFLLFPLLWVLGSTGKWGGGILGAGAAAYLVYSVIGASLIGLLLGGLVGAVIGAIIGTLVRTASRSTGTRTGGFGGPFFTGGGGGWGGGGFSGGGFSGGGGSFGGGGSSGSW